ncbi:MAG: DUF3572 family protein [Alphaproteobacteria bacterium]
MPKFEQKQAVMLAQQIFIAAAEDERQMSGFLMQSGIDAHEIRSSIDSPLFLASFLDYLMGWEPALIAACQKAEITPDNIIPIRQSLSDLHIMS